MAVFGRYLRVDVGDGSATWVDLPPQVSRAFLGGVGLGVHLLQQEAPAGVEPLAGDAPLIFALSPLVGTPLTTSAKFAVVAKSPLTNRLNDALSSSRFAIAAKKCGMDALVLVGQAARPSVLVIDEGQVSVEPAEELWGRPADETTDLLVRRLDPAFACAAIGAAGENLVRYATISHERRHAGRGGLGAVLGAKRIKAIAVRGSQPISLAHPERVLQLARDLSRRSLGPATAKYRELGTVANLALFNRLSALPTRNFQQGSFEQAEALSGEALQSARQVARASCAACTIGCEHVFAAPSGPVRLEYESLFALGSLCGIGDPDVVLEAARRCDHFGLDTISTGASVAFAMECSERGLIAAPGLRFGAASALLELIDQIGQRRGLGELLGKGTRLAAAQIGGEAPEFAPHVKGLEIPGYEPRALQSMALGFAVASRGADHNRSSAYEADFSGAVDRLHGDARSAAHAVFTEDKAALLDSLILCKFLRGVFADFHTEAAAMLSAVTGWQVDADELRTVATRIVTAKKLYNQREGWNRAEDTLPKRFLQEGLAVGEKQVQLTRERLDAMIDAYYAARGWDSQGRVPTALATALVPWHRYEPIAPATVLRSTVAGAPSA